MEDTSEIMDEPKICIFCPNKIIISHLTVKQYHNYIWNSCKYCTLIRTKLFEQISISQNGMYFCYHCLSCELEFNDLIFHLKDHCKIVQCDCPGEMQDIKDLKIEIKEESLSVKKISTHSNNQDIQTLCDQAKEKQFPVRKHARQKPLSCDECEFKASDKGNLQVHMRKHTGERPFNCEQCEYKCSRKSNLHRHMKKHTCENERLFQCDECNFKFSQKYSLQIHIRRHTGEKPFNCTLCDFRFTQKSALERHMGTHTGEKPLHCNQCEYKCSRKSHLQCHLRTHTGEKPFHCDQCEYKCSRKSTLQNHNIKKHTVREIKCEITAEDLMLNTYSNCKTKNYVRNKKKSDLGNRH